MNPLAVTAAEDRGQELQAPTRVRQAEPWSDARLVRECLEGCEEAWSALVDKYKRLIYSIPIKYGLSADQASDVFQDVCVDLLAELPRLRKPSALPKWLIQVTAHKSARLRQRTARQPVAASDGHDLRDVADGGTRSDEILLEVEREQALRAAVASLPPRCRQLVNMLFFETPPRPYHEIARNLALACGSIGFMRGRCLDRLRAELKKNGFK